MLENVISGKGVMQAQLRQFLIKSEQASNSTNYSSANDECGFKGISEKVGV